ncbi:MAG TPA: DUF3842 family protein [Eubacteriales bacterium]|nr:DUF3842 family protein [Clostridia bacterium]HRV73701.1 DUF3842 family protein [Eubacteriales bacterium]
MPILIVDGQGGNIGRQFVRMTAERFPDVEIVAVGTNSTAMANSAKRAATGENAVIVAFRKADIIAGPVGIVFADALMGEVTAAMAAAIGRSDAFRILYPWNTFLKRHERSHIGSIDKIAALIQARDMRTDA